MSPKPVPEMPCPVTHFSASYTESMTFRLPVSNAPEQKETVKEMPSGIALHTDPRIGDKTKVRRSAAKCLVNMCT
jgi:hypothetical protein